MATIFSLDINPSGTSGLFFAHEKQATVIINKKNFFTLIL